MKNILITGASGFIGSHITERCVELGYEVKAFVRYNSRNNWGWLEESRYIKDIEIVTGDIRDYDSVYSAMRGCDTVFHLAALIGIPYSYITPLGYIKTNVVGAYNILQVAKKQNLENVLITSTSETYGTAQYVPIDEKHPIVGQSPYSASKIAADQLAFSYYRSFGLPVKIVRPFNVYGPRQSARSIIPTIITQILNGQKVIRLGNLDPTRDFTFVRDTVKGFIEIASSDKLFGEITNIGMNEEISMKNLVNLIAKLINVEIKTERTKRRIRPFKSEVERLFCDNSKLLANTKWKPEYNLEKGLLLTIKWMKRNMKFYKPKIYNV